MAELQFWLQVVNSLGGLGLLLLLLLKTPALVRMVLDARQAELKTAAEEREKERGAAAAERDLDRKARHNISDRFETIVLKMTVTNQETVLRILDDFKRDGEATRQAMKEVCGFVRPHCEGG